MSTKPFDEKLLRKELKIDARGLGIPAGAADAFIDCVILGVRKSFRNKKIITESDLRRAVGKELKKYNADFAYVYQNRDKII